MKRNKKQRKVLTYLLVVLGITIGYALLSTTLKINGTAGIKSNRWDIHWENVQPNAESTVTAEEPVIDTARTKVTYEVNLELPGDFYEFTVDAKNGGTIDGEITKVDHKVYAIVNDVVSTEATTLPSYIKYSIVYDGTENPPAMGDVLESGEKQTYRIRIEYDSNSDVLPSNDTSYKIIDEMIYTQTKKEKQKTIDTNACTQMQNLVIEDNGSTGLIAINHEATDNTEALTDYRYTGANPSNYIYFNCSDESNPSTCEKWRIIGCNNDGNMKLIRDTSIGTYSYYIDPEHESWPIDHSRNDWAVSQLKSELNETYYESLSSSAKSYIVEKDWYVAGHTQTGMFSETAYVAERSNNLAVSATSQSPSATPVKGKVGVMYASDYGYGSSACHSLCSATSETCSSNTGVYNLFEYTAGEYYDQEAGKLITPPTDGNGDNYNYSARACQNSNWLYKGIDEWTMTPVFGYSEGQNQMVSTGHINVIQGNGTLRSLVSWGGYDWVNARPTVYISSKAKITGTGTNSNPYRLKTTGWVLTNLGSTGADQKWEYWDTDNTKLKDTTAELMDYSGNHNQIYHFDNKGYVILGWHKLDNKVYYSSLLDADGNGYTDGNVFHGGTIEVTNGGGVTGGTGTFTFAADGECTSNNCPAL